MADIANDTASFSKGFVDETLITVPSNLPLDEQVIPTNPSNVDSIHTNSSAKFQDDSLEIDFMTKFQKNSLVFAKLSGHRDPPWPARVAKVCWTNGIHCGYEVVFYGTYQERIVESDQIWAYDDKSVSEFAKPKISLMRKRADFFRGMAEIRDCPDIASPDIPESASQIAKKLLRNSSTNNDDINAQKREADIGEAAATSTPNKNKGKYPGINRKLSSTMIRKFRNKAKEKTSPWILSTLSKLDVSSDNDDQIQPNSNRKRKSPVHDDSTISTSSASNSNDNDITRRSKRIKKMPFWKRLEMKDEETAGSQIVPTIVHPDKDGKSSASPGGGIKVIPVQVQKAGITSNHRLRNKNEKVAIKGGNASPPPIKKSIEKATKLTNASISNSQTNRPKQTEISPRPQYRRSGENRQSLANNSTGSDEALENSNTDEKVTRSNARSEGALQGDCVMKEEQLSENPSDWTVAQTFSSIIRMDPTITPEDIKAIWTHKIDGRALIQLTFHDFVNYCQIKVGPAIKLSHLGNNLKAKSMKFQPSNNLI